MTDTPPRVQFGESDVTPDVPVVEIAATTRYQEARAVMAVVAGLCERGVPVRDIAVVARDLDAYEESLRRAAIRRGVTPVFWTQIDLLETAPYWLVASLCELFAAAEPDRETLVRPLEFGWVPQGASDGWPVPAAVLSETRDRLPSGSRPIAAWQSIIDDAAWPDDRLDEYVEWVAREPRPTPAAVSTVLGGVVDAYRETVLPARRAVDSPALLETETAARATVRMKTLVEQVRSKYVQRLADGWTAESWVAVQGMCESLARQRPGRREHGNAHAVDMLEANDVWARQVPFVIAVGLVDGEWPAGSNSTLPAEFRYAVLAGTGAAEQLAPRTAWHGGRDRDQFRDVVAAASNVVILTWHTRDTDGRPRSRSPLLDTVDAVSLSRDAREQLLSVNGELPGELAALLEDDAATVEVTEDA